VRITLRGDLLNEVERLEEQMQRESEVDEWENRTPVAPQIAKQIKALETEARESEVEFVFEGLGQGAFAKLQAAHPATAKNKRDLGIEELQWDPEAFPPALLAASCLEPEELKGNLPEWTDIHQGWSSGQVMRLWSACLTANSVVAETPKSERASEILRLLGSENSSTTARP
jgi:hypothetical protein